jgi:hypothetical protein
MSVVAALIVDQHLVAYLLDDDLVRSGDWYTSAS